MRLYTPEYSNLDTQRQAHSGPHRTGPCRYDASGCAYTSCHVCEGNLDTHATLTTVTHVKIFNARAHTVTGQTLTLGPRACPRSSDSGAVSSHTLQPCLSRRNRGTGIPACRGDKVWRGKHHWSRRAWGVAADSIDRSIRSCIFCIGAVPPSPVLVSLSAHAADTGACTLPYPLSAPRYVPEVHRPSHTALKSNVLVLTYS